MGTSFSLGMPSNRRNLIQRMKIERRDRFFMRGLIQMNVQEVSIVPLKRKLTPKLCPMKQCSVFVGTVSFPSQISAPLSTP